jgi:dihydrofolate reductase
MNINLIMAMSQNGIIGVNNQIPWRLPEDMVRFKALTKGCPVIMGRKTWDSLPEQFRPLPYRKNIVLSRHTKSLEGAECFDNIGDALHLCKFSRDVWVIGGKEIYELFMPLANRIEVTRIHQDFDGDVTAPAFDPATWILNTAFLSTSALNGLKYTFETYTRD